MPELKVLFAQDENKNLIEPSVAQKGIAYYCPACGDVLIFKQGKIKVPHFAHASTQTCNQETITHKTAKLLVQKAIVDWKADKTPAPILKRDCQVCWSQQEQPLPETVEAAVLEYRLPSGFIVDVALLTQGNPVAGVEVRVTHAVDDVKTEKLELPFIEVDGLEILAHPTHWAAITDTFKPFICRKCREHFEQFKIMTARIADEMNIELPISFYRYAPCKCYKCDKDILVFAWPGSEKWPETEPMARPRPRTIQSRFSATVKKSYWSNTCPYCKALQGNFFLYNEPGNPFFGFDCGDDTPESYHHDLMQLAFLSHDYDAEE